MSNNNYTNQDCNNQSSSQVTSKEFPVIELNRKYYLREITENDAPAFLKYFSDPQVSRYILCDIPTALEEAKRDIYYWRNVFYSNDGIYFAIARKEDDFMIGSIGFNNYNGANRRIELSYDLDWQYWQQGITACAIYKLLNYAFKRYNVNRIEAFMTTENQPSRQLLIKMNFTLEGILRNYKLFNDKFYDVLSFSFLPQDLKKLNSKPEPKIKE